MSKINPYCTSCSDLSNQVMVLRGEVTVLRKRSAAMADVVARAASRDGPNTAAILGALFSGGDVVSLAEKLSGDRAPADKRITLASAVENFERTFIHNILTANKGARGTTATQLGISRKNLWEKCKKYGIATPVAEKETA